MSELTKIMLVEDDPDIALLAQVALEEFGGIGFVHFDNGANALAALPEERPDLLILDYRMPGMNGAEVLAEVRKTDVGRDLPVIFMTASLMPKHVERLRELGALEVLAKPFDPLTLAEKIRSIWTEHHQPN